MYRAQHDKVQFVFEKRSTTIHINFDKEKTQPLGQNKNALRYLRRLRNQLGRIFRLASFRQRKHNGLIFNAAPSMLFATLKYIVGCTLLSWKTLEKVYYCSWLRRIGDKYAPHGAKICIELYFYFMGKLIKNIRKSRVGEEKILA